MTINERLVALRKTCGKTQAEFSSVLGIRQTGLSEIELGRRNVNDRHLMMLSNWKEYRVNIDWLRTGDGEMFLETESDLLEKVRAEYNLTDRQFALVKTFLSLPGTEREIVSRFIDSVHAAREKREPSIDEKVEEYRRQLEAEKSVPESSESQNGSEKGA